LKAFQAEKSVVNFVENKMYDGDLARFNKKHLPYFKKYQELLSITMLCEFLFAERIEY